MATDEKTKRTGRFYTNKAYAYLIAEKMVKEAVRQLPDGMDYIILDRCAGDGGMIQCLDDEMLSHCVISSYMPEERKALKEKYAGKVRMIIEPNGDLADALSEEFLNNSYMRKYIEDDSCAVIMVENPPFSDREAVQNNFRQKEKYEPFVMKEFKKVKDHFNEPVASYRDLSNLFIWSAFKYYLKKPFDIYIVISPLKYFHTNNIVDMEMEKGFILNKKEFGATPGPIGCIMWKNQKSKKSWKNRKWTLDCYSVKNEKAKYDGSVTISRAEKTLTPLYDRRKMSSDTNDGIIVGYDGYETHRKNFVSEHLYNDNIIGYMKPASFMISNLNKLLVRTTVYTGRGFYLRKDAFIYYLPFFAAKTYRPSPWYEKELYVTSSDDGMPYKNDSEFLKQCLIYTCLSHDNKCVSMYGSDGRLYLNELCPDRRTEAYRYLSSYVLTVQETELICLYNDLIDALSISENYREEFTYGIYQADKELAESEEDRKKLNEIHKLLQAYYCELIVPALFKYHLLK